MHADRGHRAKLTVGAPLATSVAGPPVPDRPTSWATMGHDDGRSEMRSAVLRDGAMFVRDDVADPAPGPGEVLVEVAACGICGSDLHFAKFGAQMMEVGARMEGTVD